MYQTRQIGKRNFKKVQLSENKLIESIGFCFSLKVHQEFHTWDLAEEIRIFSQWRDNYFDVVLYCVHLHHWWAPGLHVCQIHVCYIWKVGIMIALVFCLHTYLQAQVIMSWWRHMSVSSLLVKRSCEQPRATSYERSLKKQNSKNCPWSEGCSLFLFLVNSKANPDQRNHLGSTCLLKTNFTECISQSMFFKVDISSNRLHTRSAVGIKSSN